MRKIRSAQLTVEAAMIAPVLIFSVLMILYLTAHVHNRTCLFARAAEQAVSGHTQETPKLFALAETDCQRTDGENERTVLYEAGTVYLDGKTIWSIKEAATYKKYYPVKRLRQKAAAKEVIRARE